MLASIERFIVDKFIVLMIVAFFIGILLQPMAGFLNPLMLYLIMTVMFMAMYLAVTRFAEPCIC
ncbi:MAG: hypothetical protein HRT37_10295 [Alteromonadaceae bacterium]|nr:hypothetical protein [Alteromonadaceae bacterium]